MSTSETIKNCRSIALIAAAIILYTPSSATAEYNELPGAECGCGWKICIGLEVGDEVGTKFDDDGYAIETEKCVANGGDCDDGTKSCSLTKSKKKKEVKIY